MKKKFREFNDDIIKIEPETITVGEIIENLKTHNLSDKVYHIISKNNITGICTTLPITDNKNLNEIINKIFIIIPD